jgi:putative two-component system response regulator
MDSFPAGSHRILAVDDEPANLKLLAKVLRKAGYDAPTLIEDPRQVVEAYDALRPDLVLLDLSMPHMDGFAVLDRLAEKRDRLAPPVIVLTAQVGREHLVRAFEKGARDYLTKPFDTVELLARVRNLLGAHTAQKLMQDHRSVLETQVRERTEEIRRTRLQIVQRLGRAAEFRDNETGLHILRTSQMSVILARALGWTDERCELLFHASPMHDIGKIGIPDAILLKPGKLTPEEFEIIKTHTVIGAKILEGDDSDILSMARDIVLGHHEKWDGSGYPFARAGESIPVSARIVALADVFDALTSERPYKMAWPLARAVEYIKANAGKHFDPELVDVFFENLSEIDAVRLRHAEPTS